MALALPAPAGALLAYRDVDEHVVIAHDDGSAPQVVAEYGDHVSVSPDGRRLAYLSNANCGCSGSALHVTDALGRHDRVLARNVERPGGHWLPLPWSPDSRRVVVADENRGRGYVVEVKSGRRRSVRGPFFFEGATFSPSSRQLIIETDRAFDGGIFLTSLRTRRRTLLGRGRYVVWGRRGFAFITDKGVYFERRPHRKPRRLFSARHATLVPVAWSANGQRLLLSRAIGARPGFHAQIYDRRTGTTHTLRPTFLDIEAISRDGHTVLGNAEMGGYRAIVAAGDDGTTTVLAMDGSYPSWSR
jgi:hypothetical protein